MRVYLSGGMRSGWQDKVKAAVSGIEWIDPREHGLELPALYAVWDLTGVRLADVVFAYIEDDNPSGIGLALELGYAKGLGKITILVGGHDDKRMAIVGCAADVWVAPLSQGIALLQSLSRMM